MFLNGNTNRTDNLRSFQGKQKLVFFLPIKFPHKGISTYAHI